VHVGVAAWSTNATYKEPKLIVDGKTIDLPAINEWEELLKTPTARPGGPRYIRARQQWAGEEGSITNLGNNEGDKWICPYEIPAGSKYTYRVKARKNSGEEGFLMVYNYQNERDFDWFNIGGWGNSQNNIEQSVDGGRTSLTPGEEYAVEENRWYDLEVQCDGDSMSCYIDGKLQFTARHRSASMRGVYSNATIDGKTLYVKVVNVGETGTKGTLNLTNGLANDAEMVRLHSGSGNDENTMDYPLNILPRPATVNVENNGQRLTFPVAPYSVNIITVKLK